MSNKKEINQFIKDKIKQNIPKVQIQNELSSKYEAKEYEKILKDFPEPELKERYKILNGVLIACIVIVTLFKLLSIIGYGLELGAVALLIFFVIGLGIPIALIVYLLSYRATAYIGTAGLTIASLSNAFKGSGEIFASGNSVLIGIFVFQLIIVLMIIILSFYLWKKIHPDYKLFSK